jgi:hypothetical protein
VSCIELVFVCGICLLLAAPVASAGRASLADAQVFGNPQSSPALTAMDGPPPPALPQTIARDDRGRVTVRAVRIAQPLEIDGHLDEEVYGAIFPMSAFVQADPEWGQPASAQTEVWVFFDDRHLYVAARAWETDIDRMVVDEWRRDSTRVFENEVIGFMFDTFHDRRNGIVFNVNAVGTRQDAQVTDERDWNGDWSPAYESATGRFSGGWTIEMAVPFASLRYNSQREQIWGFQVQRRRRWKNEIDFLVQTPRAWGTRGIVHSSNAATMVGLEVPPPGKNLDVKPFAVGKSTGLQTSTGDLSSTLERDVGVDVKWGVRPGLIADFTYNTDFAQAEVDLVQTNLTRFNLFFPEKRDFFLENKGLFTFGGVGANTPVLFYSRQIGLSGGQVVPIEGGGRLTGRLGPYSVGLISIRQDEAPVAGTPATTFSVARVRRDMFRRGAVGAMVTERSIAMDGRGRNMAYGLDGQFLFKQVMAVNAYWAQTSTTGQPSHETASYRGQVDYQADTVGFQVEHLVVGENFLPQVGFVPRLNMRRTYVQPRYSVRPKDAAVVLRYNVTGSLDYIENSRRQLESRARHAEFSVEFRSNDELKVYVENNHELVLRSFTIGPNVRIPLGTYDFDTLHAEYDLGGQRRLSGVMFFEKGTFYGGEKTSLSFNVRGNNAGRLVVTRRLAVEPGVTINRVTMPQRTFTSSLITANTIFGFTPTLYATALVQYSSDAHTMRSNVRLRWEYRPGSELFVVYNDQRDTTAALLPSLQNRSVIVKVNRLIRF